MCARACESTQGAGHPMRQFLIDLSFAAAGAVGYALIAPLRVWRWLNG
jgi:hypothetical protein